MNKIFRKKIIITFIISSILFYSIGIYAATLHHAKDLAYNNDDWNVSNVNDALDSLYLMQYELNSIKLGDAKSSEIMVNKTALVDGKKIIGKVENKGELNWNPSISTTYNVPVGYYTGGTLDSTSAYQSGYDDGYSEGSQDGLDDLINSVFTFKLPMKNEFKTDDWSKSASTTYTFTYNKGTITKPSSSTATQAKYGSQYFKMYCTNAVIKFVSSKEIWVTFSINGKLDVSWESSKSTSYIVKYKWTTDKTKGTVTVVDNNISWDSGSYDMKINRNGTPTVTVS